MKKLLRIEELAMLGISIYALYFFNAPWWCYLLLVIAPDISMIAYAAGNRMGAIVYNLFHHKAVAILLFLFGLIVFNHALQIAGVILFGHASMDRVFGYGLKYLKGFKNTHLGLIGRTEDSIEIQKV